MKIAETFDSIQGEGFHAGKPAFFIRLAGCNVACPIKKQCDTDYGFKVELEASGLVALASQSRAEIVVVTGGEPLEQDVKPIVAALQKSGKRVHVETSGLYPAEHIGFDWITCSPKARASALKTWANEVKVVYLEQPDAVLREYETSGRELFLQPLWNGDTSVQGMTNAAQTIETVKRLGGRWRVSIQTHKFLGVR